MRDKFLEVDGTPVKDGQDVVDAVSSHGPGDPVKLLIERSDRRLTVEIEPQLVAVEGEAEKQPRIGISLGIGYDFPFEVSIKVDPSIGGPSAGLMFSLAIYDTLTPGSLTDGEIIAGTGELTDDGTVGPIGGIEQKIAAAEDAGAELFFVPKDNCADVEDIDPDLPWSRRRRCTKRSRHWRSGPTTTTPICRAAERDDDGLRARRPTRRSPPPCWRSRSTRPAWDGTSRPASTRSSTPQPWSRTSRPSHRRSGSMSPASADR